MKNKLSLVEKFGSRGEKGLRAEEFVRETIRSWGWDVIDHNDDMNMQRKGCDLSIRKPTWYNFYTVDVKGNMNSDGSFFVETGKDGWLRNPVKCSHRIWHCNVDTGWMAWYSREDMFKYIKKIGRLSDGLVLIKPYEGKKFITRSRQG